MKVAYSFVILLLSLSALSSEQQPEEQWLAVEGKHFSALPSANITNLSEHATVRYYFWPASESCYQFELALKHWQQTHPDVQIERIPLVARPNWRLLAKAWLVAVEMKVADIFLDNLYQSIHVNQTPITNIEQLMAFIKSLNSSELIVDKVEFQTLFHSTLINQQLNLIENESHLLSISAVPTIIINNQWISDASKVDSSRQLLMVIESLISK